MKMKIFIISEASKKFFNFAKKHPIIKTSFPKTSSMKTSDKAQIDDFLGQQHIALAGYSHNPKKFGHQVYEILKQKGYTIHPVNPSGGTATGGEVVHQGLDTLPPEVETLLIMTKPEVTLQVAGQAVDKGLKRLWVQQMSGSKAVEDMLNGKQVDVVYNRCILLHANPTGIHKFHRRILGFFGRLPH